MSTTQEFYIRKATENDARGPFNLEQLVSLAETGQLDPDTYYYDAAAESWTLISANAELMESVFPAKKALRVRAKTASEVKTLNVVTAQDRPITVNDMLAAADGRTEDTKDKADPEIGRGRAAAVGIYSGTAILLIVALAFILPEIDRVLALDFAALSQTPLVFLGVFHLILAVCLGLGATGAYPTVRFCAVLTIGFTVTLYHLDGQPALLGYSVAANAGLFLCTLMVNMPGVIVSGLVGLAGALGLAHHYFTT